MGDTSKRLRRKRRQQAIQRGRARTAALSAAERSAIARTAAEARWRSAQAKLGPEEIGDVLFEPEDTQIRLTIAEQRDQTTWTMEGAQAVIQYLRRWIRERRQRQRVQDVPLPSSDN